MRALDRLARRVGAVIAMLACASTLHAEELPEYRLKAAFVYNFALFTEWPAEVGRTLHLCIRGQDPFGKEIDAVHGKPVGQRTIEVLRRASGDSLGDCEIVYLAPSAIEAMPRILESLRGRPILTIADSPGTLQAGVMLNMKVAQNRVVFEANLKAARAAGLALSSRLLQLATEVLQ